MAVLKFWDEGTQQWLPVAPGPTGATPNLVKGTIETGDLDFSITGTPEEPVLSLVLPTAGPGGVNTAALQDDAVTAAKIAPNAVGSSELADNAVDTAAIADSAVTTAKIGNGQVQNANLGDGAVTSRVLGTGAVNSAAIEDGTIVNGDIATNAAIAASKISGTALVASTADAKGDLYVATANDTVARLAVGANNTILTADSSATPGVKWATPTTRVGTGSPLSVVVPDFKGQRYIDTDQTLGAREWVATTTLASGWVVSDGDTGPYQVASALTPGADFTLNVVNIRRVGPLVTVSADVSYGGTTTAAGITQFVLPLGFRPATASIRDTLCGSIDILPELRHLFLRNAAANGAIEMYGATNGKRYRWLATFPTADPWPTSAPV